MVWLFSLKNKKHMLTLGKKSTRAFIMRNHQNGNKMSFVLFGIFHDFSPKLCKETL